MKTISPKHQMVCDLVMAQGLDGVEAYVKVYGGKSRAGAKASYYAMVKREDVQRYMGEVKAGVAKGVQERTIERVTAQAGDLIGGLQQMVDADPRELIEYRRGACRYCHGEDHLYQYTPAEHRKLSQVAGFDEAGGIGYNRTVAPHPACPECFGEGEGYSFIKDTRNISPAAARLFAGVEQTASGHRLKIRDSMKPTELLMRNRGLLTPPEGATPAGTTAQEHAQAVRDLLALAGAKTDVPGS